MPEMTDAYQWHGRTMVGSDGDKIGKITEIYEDPETGKPEWATVSSGLFGTKSNFVPLAGASPDGEDVRANVTKDQVKDAPGVENDGDLSEPEERRLFEHYGVPYTTDGNDDRARSPERRPGHRRPPTTRRPIAQRPTASRWVTTPAARQPMTR